MDWPKDDPNNDINMISDGTASVVKTNSKVLWGIEKLIGNATILENRSCVFYVVCERNKSGGVFSVRWVRAKWF
jgi:hypothetical protein